MNERRINSLNLKENTTYNWLEYQFLSMFHLFASDVQELKWHDFLQDQLTEHQIGYIREEIVSTAIANVLEKYYFKKKLFQFNSECARVVWLRLFNWIFLRLDPYWRQDTTGKAIHLIVDIEPQPSSVDSWIFGKVSQISIQKSIPTLTCIPLLPSITATKPLNRISQKQQTKLRYINKEKLKQKNKEGTMISSEIKKSCEVVNERKKSNGYSKNDSYLSMPKQHTIDSTERIYDQPNNFKEKNKTDLLVKISKQNGNNNDDSKQENITNIRQLSKNLKQNKMKLLPWGKETAAKIPLQRSLERIEIMCTILPDHSDYLETNTLNAKRMK
ncbi:uncharacterized protein LOC117208183 isoform X2 [Bombus bifarius]|uniref:Uncharacterized protein LOC117208183 isoform X2 n=1 Tax=Bombus bifarius TaxID=103933 RepID=A0A6P8LVF0_9HYME|nr:uncharacterized protein LOC117208183 isoform X2 [Bombus bifarius]